jgi:hypothetical protein
LCDRSAMRPPVPWLAEASSLGRSEPLFSEPDLAAESAALGGWRRSRHIDQRTNTTPEVSTSQIAADRWRWGPEETATLMLAAGAYGTWAREEEARPLFPRAPGFSPSGFEGWRSQMTVGPRSSYRKAIFLPPTRRKPDSVGNRLPRHHTTRRTYSRLENRGCIVGSASWLVPVSQNPSWTGRVSCRSNLSEY